MSASARRITFGNTGGDMEMLQWTTAGSGARQGLVLHDDAEREFAYARPTGCPTPKIGTFSQALMDAAEASGWTVMSMKNDWKPIFDDTVTKTE